MGRDSDCLTPHARRRPPRLRRWRSVRPEEAGTGAAGHRWAKDASEASRSGLSPAVTSSCPAVSVPTPGSSRRSGAVRVIRTRRSASASAISSLKCRYRLARRLRATLTAVAGSARSVPGRLTASLRTLWDRFDLGRKRWLRGRAPRVGRLRRHSTAVIGGLASISSGLIGAQPNFRCRESDTEIFEQAGGPPRREGACVTPASRNVSTAPPVALGPYRPLAALPDWARDCSRQIARALVRLAPAGSWRRGCRDGGPMGGIR